MAIKQSTFDILKKKGSQYGLPVSVWYPIVMTESGGNPLAVGDSGYSHGLFQVYTKVHPDYNIQKGKSSIEYQADYWMPQLATAYKKGKEKGLSGLDLTLYVERYGERPKWTQTVIKNITYYYNKLGQTVKDFLMPTEGKITSNYGYRNDPITGEKKFHSGVDIAAPLGTAVKSVLGGIVKSTGYSSSYGNYIEISTPAGVSEYFAHLSKILVDEGDTIVIGDTIGKVGSTGRSTGSHLHYEIRKDGKKINPLEYLKNAVGSAVETAKDSISSFIDKLPRILGDTALNTMIYVTLFIIIIISLFFMFMDVKKADQIGKFAVGFAPGGGVIKELI